MKFGIDVNNECLCKIALDKIRDNGQLVVDLTIEKWSNRGQEVFKKVLLANITNIDFYIGIEFSESDECYKIFYSNNEYSKKCSLRIKESLSEEIENVICEDGNKLYLIKNMNAQGVYIRLPLKSDNEENIKVLDKIIKELVNNE